MVDYVTVRKENSGLTLLFKATSIEIFSETFSFADGTGGTIYNIQQIEKAKNLYISHDVVVPKNVYFEGTVIIMGSKIKTETDENIIIKDCVIIDSEIVLQDNVSGLYAKKSTIECCSFDNVLEKHYIFESRISNCSVANDIDARSSEITESEISFANITDSTVSGSRLSSSTIIGSNLQKTRMYMSRVTALNSVSSDINFSAVLNSTFKNVISKESTFENTEIDSGKFQDSNLKESNTYGSDFSRSCISNCEITLCNFKSCSVKKCIAESSIIKKSDFEHINVRCSLIKGLYHKKSESIRYNIENASISCALDFVIVGQSIAYRLHTDRWRISFTGKAPSKTGQIVNKDEIPERPLFKQIFPKEHSIIAKAFYAENPNLDFFVSLFDGEIEKDKQEDFMVWLKKYVSLTSVVGSFEILKKSEIGKKINDNMKYDIKNGVFVGYVPILNEESIYLLERDKIIKSGMYDLLRKKEGIVKISF